MVDDGQTGKNKWKHVPDMNSTILEHCKWYGTNPCKSTVCLAIWTKGITTRFPTLYTVIDHIVIATKTVQKYCELFYRDHNETLQHTLH